jgi:hypothetical protein
LEYKFRIKFYRLTWRCLGDDMLWAHVTSLCACDFHSCCECKEPITQIIRSSKKVAWGKSAVYIDITVVGLL